jgi:hypothetical protein
MDTDLHFYIFSGFGWVMDYPFFVGYPPNPPDTYIKITSTPPHLIFLSLSFTYFLPPPSLPASFAPTPPSRRHHFLTASLPYRLTQSFSLLHFQLSPSLSSSRSCSGAAFLSTFFLGKSSPSRSGSKSGETSLDLVRPH